MSVKSFLQTWGFVEKERSEVPVYKRLQGDSRGDSRRVSDVGLVHETQLLSTENVRYENPGAVTTESVYDAIRNILEGDYSQPQQYKMLDNLTFAVYNCHPDGMAAQEILDDISAAIEATQRAAGLYDQ